MSGCEIRNGSPPESVWKNCLTVRFSVESGLEVGGEMKDERIGWGRLPLALVGVRVAWQTNSARHLPQCSLEWGEMTLGGDGWSMSALKSKLIVNCVQDSRPKVWRQEGRGYLSTSNKLGQLG